MKLPCLLVSLAIGLLASTRTATAAVIGGRNWADTLVDHTANIQNYSGEMMAATNQWWVLGPSDADVNGNGYAWDEEDKDYVAGWRATAPGEHIVVAFDIGLPDLEGNDLIIHMYCGSKADGSVLASVDGISYTQIGSLGPGAPGYFSDEQFDFDGAFGEADVHYVKVLRQATGKGTGMFFDSFASVPEPTSLTLLGASSLLMATFWMVTRRRLGDKANIPGSGAVEATCEPLLR